MCNRLPELAVVVTFTVTVDDEPLSITELGDIKRVDLLGTSTAPDATAKRNGSERSITDPH